MSGTPGTELKLSQSAPMWTVHTTSGLCTAGTGRRKGRRRKKRDMSLIFHTVNKMIFSPLAVQGKYTASHRNFSKMHTCMHSHTHAHISKSLQGPLPGNSMQTGFFFFFTPSLFLPVLHKTTCLKTLCSRLDLPVQKKKTT